MTELQDRILSMLIERDGAYLSGEAMAETLGVSRAGVLKAIRALQADGYEIQSTRRLGHRLAVAPAALNADYMEARLRALELDMRVIARRTIDSTNNEGKKEAHGLTRPLLIAADEQTAGRGRRGHTFYSPAGSGLYMSVVAPTQLPIREAALCTQAMAVAAMEAIEALSGPTVWIKWVNDLFVSGRKVAGILTEAVTNLETQDTEAVVCGIGFNLTTEAFPEEIRHTAGSLGALNRNELAVLTAAAFLRWMRQLPDTTGWLDKYRARSLAIKNPLSFEKEGRLYHGVGEAIDDQGRLLVRLETGESVVLSSGEISIRLT